MDQDVKPHLEQAVAAMNQGNVTAAEAALDAAAGVAMGHPDVLHLRGLIRHHQGRTQEAIDLVKQAVETAPGLTKYLVDLVALHFEAGDAQGGKKKLEQAVEANPDNADLHYQLGRVRVVLGDGDGALEALGRAAELAPDAPAPYGALGVVYQSAGDIDAARAAYETAIELGSREADDFFNLGTVFMNERQWDEAVGLFTRATELNPKYQRAFANIGLILGRNADYAAAIEPLRQALALDPDDGRVVNELIYALAVAGDAAEGAETGLKFLKLHPEARELNAQIAFAWLRAGEPEKAIKAADNCHGRGIHPTPSLAMKSAALNELKRRDEAAELLDFDRFLAVKQQSAPAGYADIDAFNKDLIAYLMAHPSLTYSTTNRSMEKGRGSLELFDGSEQGPALALKAMIREMADGYLKDRPADPDHPFLAEPPRDFEITCWGNVYDREGRQLVHYHPTAYLSGVYYPALPPEMGEDEGGIEFGRAFHMIGSTDDPPVRVIRPAEGTMVMFPSYFGHQTIPVTSTEAPRVSFAFDLAPAQSED